MCRSWKDGYRIFLNSEYSVEDAERFFSDLLKYTEYLMLAQAVAYLLGKCDLVKGFHWSEGDNPQWRFLTSTPSRNSSSEVWSWWTRNHCQLQMDSQMERKDVLKDWVKCSFKNQGVSQKDPWWDTFTGLVLWRGVIRGRIWRLMCWKIPWNRCGSGGCFLGTSQATAETQQVIFGEWDEAKTLKFVLFI